MENSKEIKDLLFKKYAPPAYAFFVEVANGTGSNASRYADGVAVNLWPSQGYEITGFEIKVSRQDFLNELKKPWKADSVMSYCSRWYLVAPKGLIQKEELPENWGFIEVSKGKLFTKKVAPVLQRTPIAMPFVAALLRRATESTIPIASLETYKAEVKKEAEANAERMGVRSVGELRNLREKVEEFQKASGVDIDSWRNNATDIGEAVRYVLEGRLKKKTSWNIERAISGLEGMIKDIKNYEKEIAEL